MKRNLIAFIILTLVLRADNVSFLSKSLTAGKASLTENAYILARTLETANFSPELRLPIQLVYRSDSQKNGMFGFAWSSPQLESMAFYDKDAVLWTTPWGEKIRFSAKRQIDEQEMAQLATSGIDAGKYVFSSHPSEWKATTIERNYARSAEWVFYRGNGRNDWQFHYQNYRLKRVVAPSGKSIVFNYHENHLISISQDNSVFVEVNWQGDMVDSMTVNNILFRFAYRMTPLVILPKTEHGKITNADCLCLTSIQKASLNPESFIYDDYGFLCKVHQGNFAENMKVQHQTLEERIAEIRKPFDYHGPVNGRIEEDLLYRYEYSDHAVILTDKLDRKASYKFDSKNGILDMTEFSGKSHVIYYFMRYDVAYLGKVRKIVDGRKREVASFSYDGNTGEMTSMRDMAGNVRQFRHDADGRLVLVSRIGASRNVSEPVRSFEYDQQGNMVRTSILDEAGKAVLSTEIRYNEDRLPSEIGNGQTHNLISYNGFGYPVSVTNAFGQTIRRTLDDFNRMTAMTDVHGVTTDYTYTDFGQPSKIERRDGDLVLASMSIGYDGNGLPVSYTDKAGRTRLFERDAFGRIVKELFPDETEVAYSYNEMGQLSSVLDQNKHTIRFDWNQFGLDARYTPAEQMTDYVRDDHGLVRQMTVKAGQKEELNVQYEYDEFDRMVKADYGDGDVETLMYDDWNRVVARRRGKMNAAYKYDYWGRMVERKTDDETLSIVYNPYGQRIERTIERKNLKLNEKREYDTFGRLVRIIADGKTVEYSYNDRNQLCRQNINGTIVEFEYDKYGRLKSKNMIENK